MTVGLKFGQTSAFTDLYPQTNRFRTSMSPGTQHNSVACIIPAEIWMNVFGLCIDERAELRITFPRTGMGRLHRFIVFSQVCSRWRGIITLFQKFWTTFHLNFSALNDKDPEMLKMFLDRSALALLDIRIFLYSNDTRETHTYITAAWDVLSEHLSRCSTLSLYSRFGGFSTLLRPPTKVSLDELVIYEESFDIRDSYIDQSSEYAWYRSLWRAPKLRTFDTATIAHILPLDYLPYHQLTTMHINPLDRRNLDTLQRVTPFCGALQKLTMNILLHEGAALRYMPIRIVIPTLKTLSSFTSHMATSHYSLNSLNRSHSLPSNIFAYVS